MMQACKTLTGVTHEAFWFGANGDPGSHLGREDLGAMGELTPAQQSRALEQLIRGLERQIRGH